MTEKSRELVGGVNPAKGHWHHEMNFFRNVNKPGA